MARLVTAGRPGGGGARIIIVGRIQALSSIMSHQCLLPLDIYMQSMSIRLLQQEVEAKDASKDKLTK